MRYAAIGRAVLGTPCIAACTGIDGFGGPHWTPAKRSAHLRAAAVLAGVTLERHLGKVVVLHQITMTKRDPTIADFNEALKKNGDIDVPEWRAIQRYADLRNLAAHGRGRDPLESELAELLSGVARIVKTLH